MTRWYDRIAHDLKGPLAPLQTASYLLKSEGLPPERQRELADVVDRQARRLNRMIEELGDYARASEHRLRLRIEPCPLALVLDLAIGSVPGSAIDPRYDAGLDSVAVAGDEGRLVQLFASLIAHLQARAPGQTPELRVTAADGRVRVELLGAGPSPDAETLTAMFERADPAPHDEGLGLRLMLAYAIAQMHGGSLAAHAPDGGGLMFVCELPLAPG
ncbi:MAG: hypothetical protein AVDCRST_MAG71-2789 [uncultured Lysobacter sp.]|uniref:histidine kinase n=1 Tax=uncultured Lysobacter sp. TaxID=271060 RepID=A0A6J4M6L8_9GAMM|nr:MAG: hypothetical protein AVDCRST_MAG71-2789 [uncultured Lysobacter sp.]